MKPEHPAPVSTDPSEQPASVCEMCGLDAIACGLPARVVRLSGTPRIVRRLLALGVRPSTTCEVLGRTPGGGPIHLRAGSVHLMVRASEAAEVLVQPTPEEGDERVLPVL